MSKIIELVREELTDLIGFRGEPVVTRVVRWDRAMPQYHVGHLDRVKRIEQAIDPGGRALADDQCFARRGNRTGHRPGGPIGQQDCGSMAGVKQPGERRGNLIPGSL